MTAFQSQRWLLVIITEAHLERRIATAAVEAGVHGYTAMDARGMGRHGKRSGAFQEDRNVRMELVCEEAAAERIAAWLQAELLPHHAVTVYKIPVGVLRPEKF